LSYVRQYIDHSWIIYSIRYSTEAGSGNIGLYMWLAFVSQNLRVYFNEYILSGNNRPI